jgi:hypothetical protein
MGSTRRCCSRRRWRRCRGCSRAQPGQSYGELAAHHHHPLGGPRERAGSASGVATTNNSLGAALGVAILGAVGTLNDAGSTRWAPLSAAALVVAGSDASLAFPTRSPADDDHPVGERRRARSASLAGWLAIRFEKSPGTMHNRHAQCRRKPQPARAANGLTNIVVSAAHVIAAARECRDVWS